MGNRVKSAIVVMLLGALAFGLAGGVVYAYPEKPVTVIVHTPAGGGTDVMARVVFEHVEKRLGVPFVIENVSGAGGQIGWSRLATSPADGYTIGAFSLS